MNLFLFVINDSSGRVHWWKLVQWLCVSFTAALHIAKQHHGTQVSALLSHEGILVDAGSVCVIIPRYTACTAHRKEGPT